MLVPVARRSAANWTPWMPVLAGMLVMYAPTFLDLARWYWPSEEGAHGLILLGIVAWLFWRKRDSLVAARAQAPAMPAAGWISLVLGSMLYVVGRSQEIILFEVGSLIPMLAGAIIAMRGWRAVRMLWFPILFVVFLIPLPALVVDALTAPLKQSVSAIAEHLLYAAGYPVARSGVVLIVGPYQLLVADACSGLQSMFSLAALGLLYMYLNARTGVFHKVIMLVSILPIAFVANVVRVLLLILVTLYFGDEAGQGFLHGAAGVVLLLAALTALLLLDGILARLLPRAHAA